MKKLETKLADDEMLLLNTKHSLEERERSLLETANKTLQFFTATGVFCGPHHEQSESSGFALLRSRSRSPGQRWSWRSDDPIGARSRKSPVVSRSQPKASGPKLRGIELLT